MSRPGSPYFTVSKAQQLTRICFERAGAKISDSQLQEIIVKLRDFKRYMDYPEIYGDKLRDGGYYALVIHPSVRGLTPVDMFVHRNIQYTLDEALKERRRREKEWQELLLFDLGE